VYKKLQNVPSISLLEEKMNMDEFGMGSFTTNSIHGAAVNPRYNEKRSAGGSSGGSAVSVALGHSDISIASDTGGSIRLPANFCNIIGFKPSYGSISRYGLIPYAHSLDTVGILGRDIKDIRFIYELVRGLDPNDPTGIEYPPENQFEEFDWRNIRIGIPEDYNVKGIHPDILQCWETVASALGNLGATITTVPLPHSDQALAAYYIIVSAEAYSNLAKYDGIRYGNEAHSTPESMRDHAPKDSHLWTKHCGQYLEALSPTDVHRYRSQGFGAEVKKRLKFGSLVLEKSATTRPYDAAQKARLLIQNDFDLVFRLKNPITKKDAPSDGVDFLLCPVAPIFPPLLSELDSIDPYANDIFTVPASLAGLPAISIPLTGSAWFKGHKGLTHPSLGLQLITQRGFDISLLVGSQRIMTAAGIC
jgi:aspartyl-tRNA(Asn)/glutamyl-tRNA(Gln) amidotransferase subunit A